MPVSNTELKKVKLLLTKKGRKEQRMFLAEGIRLLEESIRFRFWPRTVYYTPSMLSDRGEELLKQFESSGVRTVKLSARQLNSLADTETPQGIVGLFSMPADDMGELYSLHQRMLLLCENVSDPGNLGTLVRSALAFGFDLVLLCGNTAEPYAPKVVRASAGAVFGVRMAEVSSKEVDALIAKEGISIIASDLSGEADFGFLKERVKNRKILLAIGSEATGLSKVILERADIRVRIRHLHTVESLNAAVAGSIIMKELFGIVNEG